MATFTLPEGITKFDYSTLKKTSAILKTHYTKMDKLKEKINALFTEYKNYENQNEMWEEHAKKLSMSLFNREFNSREMLEYCDNPEEFKVKYNLIVPEEPAESSSETSSEEPFEYPSENETL